MSERKSGKDDSPIPPYALYNIDNSHPENLLELVNIVQQEPIRAKSLPADCDFEVCKELVSIQLADVLVTYANTTPFQNNFGYK